MFLEMLDKKSVSVKAKKNKLIEIITEQLDGWRWKSNIY